MKHENIFETTSKDCILVQIYRKMIRIYKLVTRLKKISQKFRELLCLLFFFYWKYNFWISKMYNVLKHRFVVKYIWQHWVYLPNGRAMNIQVMLGYWFQRSQNSCVNGLYVAQRPYVWNLVYWPTIKKISTQY